jgi:hypothetical protein
MKDGVRRDGFGGDRVQERRQEASGGREEMEGNAREKNAQQKHLPQRVFERWHGTNNARRRLEEKLKLRVFFKEM